MELLEIILLLLFEATNFTKATHTYTYIHTSFRERIIADLLLDFEKAFWDDASLCPIIPYLAVIPITYYQGLEEPLGQ